MITVAQRQELEDALERTLAATEHASDYQRPVLLRIAEMLRAQLDEPNGYAISQHAGRAEVSGGAASLDGREIDRRNPKGISGSSQGRSSMNEHDDPPERQAAQDAGADLLTTSVMMAGSARGRHVLVSLSGQADLANSGPLREILDRQVARKTRKLVIDLGELEFMDSSVLHVLLLAGRAMGKHGGLMALARPREPVARVLRLTGADRLIAVYDSVAEATGG